MKTIMLLSTDNTSVSGVTGALEIFNIANIVWNLQNPGKPALFNCSVVSTENINKTLCEGLHIKLDKKISKNEKADAVILTGFLYQNLDHLQEKLDEARPSSKWLIEQYKEGAIIGASCSGTAVLAETGLLNGKNATTSWWLTNVFRKHYPDVKIQIEKLLVTDGRLFTAGAVTSYQNLVLRLIEELAGRELAMTCSKMMLIDYNRFSQAPFAILQSILDTSDDIVNRARFWINENFSKKIDLQKLARNLGITYRTLIRRFKSATGETPTQYVQKTRIEAAKRLLATTDMSLEMVIERVGYFDPSSFNLLFKRLTQLTPREYRLRFML